MTIELEENDWPFDEPHNVATFTTTKVLYEGHPILLVTHDEVDDSWQFLCGTTNEPGDVRIVGLKSMYDRDKSIGELADLPCGWCAWRESPESKWHREPNVRHDDD